MKHKKLLVLIVLFVVLGTVIVIYNPSKFAPDQGTEFDLTSIIIWVVIFIILGVVLYGIIYFVYVYILHKGKKSLLGVIGYGEEPGNVISPEKREQNAIDFMNEHWQVVKYVSEENNGESIVLIDKMTTPERKDAISWEYYLFGAIKHDPNVRAGITSDRLPDDKKFYVYTNKNTGECFTLRPKDDKDAMKMLDKLFWGGVEKIRGEDVARKLGESALMGMGMEFGKDMASKEEKEESESSKEKEDEEK